MEFKNFVLKAKKIMEFYGWTWKVTVNYNIINGKLIMEMLQVNLISGQNYFNLG